VRGPAEVKASASAWDVCAPIRVCEEPPGTARRTAAVHEAPADPVHGIDYHPVITDWLAGLPGTSGDGGIAGEGAGRFAGWPTCQQGS
jgi:hypothetical protein